MDLDTNNLYRTFEYPYKLIHKRGMIFDYKNNTDNNAENINLWNAICNQITFYLMRPFKHPQKWWQ
jgi:hypothetical protein